MTWLQENWMIAVVGLVVAVALLWWLFGRARPAEVAPPTVEPAKPAKPLEPAKPDIIAAEPARFKPIEPKPAPVAPAPPPAPGPAATPPPAPVAEPVAEAPPKPAANPKPAAKKTATKAPAAKATVKKAAAKPPADAAAIPAEPTVPPPAAEPAPTTAQADNLQLLKGVGPKLVVLLNGLGVTRFQQIAEWTDADIARIDAQLGAFQGRIARDNLVDQASHLARGDKAGFEAKYGALGGEL